MHDRSANLAPGAPGDPPRWTSSRKVAVGTARGRESSVWFTIGDGVVSEVYYPRIDLPCLRELALLVTDGRSWTADERDDVTSECRWMAEGIPGFELINRCRAGRFQTRKQIIADPVHDALLQRTVFTPLVGELGDYHVYAFVQPHLHDQGKHNVASLGDAGDFATLRAERDGVALAVASSAPWLARSVGFVGESDGRTDLMRHHALRWSYERTAPGNVALTGEIDLVACAGEFTIAIGFGRDVPAAEAAAGASLAEGFESARKRYQHDWAGWQRTLSLPPSTDGDSVGGVADPTCLRASAAVLATHESKTIPGGMIASLSLPWGAIRGDDDRAGYHVVWPRDCCETAGGLLALGDDSGQCDRMLGFLTDTQREDGSWPQNMWLDGSASASGSQLDEVALPILLGDLVRRHRPERMIARDATWWPTVRRAADYIVRRGPRTNEDRWERTAGYTAFTVSAAIAALVIAGGMARERGERSMGSAWESVADNWNVNLEARLYVRDTPLARRVGVDGYYVRIAPRDARFVPLEEQRVPLVNKGEGAELDAVDLVSCDALALVRFGLRSADDPRILNTVKVIDAVLKSRTPNGPVWHRYNEDGYGEHEDGSPFDGSGVGRGWPLLVGERAHYEIAAGRVDVARSLLRSIERFATETHLIPEQVWDAADIPSKGMTAGRPTGSACPLVWAHSEYVKLARSLPDGRVFDMRPRVL